MSNFAEMELYCSEAKALVLRADAAFQALEKNGACEGHLLIAAQAVSAIRRLDRLIENRRKAMPVEMCPHPVEQARPVNRSWWPVVKLRARNDAVHA